MISYLYASGVPLSELDLPGGAASLTKANSNELRKPADVTLVRSRIFYAKPSLTAKGTIQSGLKHIRKSAPLSASVSC